MLCLPLKRREELCTTAVVTSAPMCCLSTKGFISRGVKLGSMASWLQKGTGIQDSGSLFLIDWAKLIYTS